MKILLTAVNSKYIHSNPAVYELKSYYEKETQKKAEQVWIAEYTINQPLDEIIGGIYEKRPDVVALSCYLWNIEYVQKLIPELKKVLPALKIWLGGPEVSYNAEFVLQKNPQADVIIIGEGEQPFLALCEAKTNEKSYAKIPGICYRSGQAIVKNATAALCEMDSLPFIYEDLKPFQNKIIYYESSRGCPYGCSYCLSSVSRCVRFKSLDKVYEELQFFLDQKVAQVKFVDRTFNCSHERTKGIFQFLLEHDNQITNFHFEISGDLMSDEETDILRQMRPGLVQLEIGVQTINPTTIHAIHRTMDLKQLSHNVARIHEGKNVHQHLDLIAGLPYEDAESFQKSFDYVYALQPEQLQLGFLKVLKGSDMYAQAGKYGIVYQDRPPYEVMYTNWISYDEILYLKKIEKMVEAYYNSRQYVHTMEYWGSFFSSAFAMYAVLVSYYEKRNLFAKSQSRTDRYTILQDCIQRWAKDRQEFSVQTAEEILLFDLYQRERLKKRPYFAADEKKAQPMQRYLYEQAVVPKAVHVERFSRKTKQILQKEVKEKAVDITEKSLRNESVTNWYVGFDYENKDPLNASASVFEIVTR